MAVDRTTVRVSRIPQTALAKDLFDFFEEILGKNSIYACEIVSDHKNWKSRGYGRVQFETLEAKATATFLSRQGNLVFKGSALFISKSFDDLIVRPVETRHRLDNGFLYAGFMVRDDCMSVLGSWERVRAWVMPERKRVEFWLEVGKVYYKLEIHFEDLLEASGCCLGGEGKSNAILLKLKHGPKIYQKVSDPDIASKLCADRYRICKEDVKHIWVRTTDFSATKSIGHSSSFCWEIDEGSSDLDIFDSFPYYKEHTKDLILEDGEEFCATSETVPLVKYKSDSKLSYEVLFQLNSLVHAQKISLAAVNSDLISTLNSLAVETTIMILEKLHKLKFICYDPLSFVKTQLHLLGRNGKNTVSSSLSRLSDHNVMSCHRVLITPSKIYCLGPEHETSNYVVKNYASYASDFLRVSFVDEDWSKLPSNAFSASIQQGIFYKPFKTGIYHRILSILREGIVIGAKRFQFLAFSASQLRSNSVWMFASNDNVTAEDIRGWMGCFKKIRSVSKCAARMGQLFSSSLQTAVVPVQDVEIIPDIEVVSDGVGYCFSDGIGKISLSFARQVAQKCGLSQTPSAFQIRYGGYKGVIAVDRNSFRKLSLRSSMLKFESKNRMLNVTKWSESMPCYLNREIVALLSTLGVEDSVFETMQSEQIYFLDKMLTNREAALDVLESMGVERKNVLVKMLLQGYEPIAEPYLSMMLQAHRESQFYDLRSRCRIFVPNGRVLIGCLDETGILNYGQVYVRVTMTKAELQFEDKSFFRMVDETTTVVIGKVVVTKNPCLHPGDIRVLEAVYEVALEEKGLVDCVVFPQKGERPHPNECSGGDLDGDLFFISWDKGLIPTQTENPMDYTGRRTRQMDHDVTLEEIQQFFVDYMINDTLGAISTAHLVHADREPDKARSPKCLQLATLHSMAVDFAKTGAPAEMPIFLKPKEYPDFMGRGDKHTYTSVGILGKLYRATTESRVRERSSFVWSQKIAEAAYDRDLEVAGFEAFLEIAVTHKEMYMEKMNSLFNFYGASTEDEILTGNLRNRSMYLQRDNRRYAEMKDRISISIKILQKEAKGWFQSGCMVHERQMMASAWYHVTYHPTYSHDSGNCLSFPWIVADILLIIKSVNSRRGTSNQQPVAHGIS
ncbi:RNA-dependent RNA polymerase 2 [Malania oleifera]|uniref:RNA-dependent RNA polymerase 2 n=1 Tax=Malania oleifera TaxID=397392 RepID=UPI0025AE9977|nr:RNA-dependent RNA polymerase 2 [Malania oleifera]